MLETQIGLIVTTTRPWNSISNDEDDPLSLLTLPHLKFGP